MNYSQIMSPVPLCLEKWGVMTPPSSYGSAAPVCVVHLVMILCSLNKEWL